MKTNEIPKEAEYNFTIYDSYAKAKSVLEQHESAYCSVSGGKDSDCMMDIIWRLDADRKVKYAWFNTGIEYEATKRHLDELEAKYGVKIERVKPVKSVPQCVKEYGVPFVSKHVSEQMERGQKKNFTWEDKNYEALVEEHGGYVTFAKWWCNRHYSDYQREHNYTMKWRCSMFDIERNKGLKEFLIASPPDFKISNKCCHYAKKLTAKNFERTNGCTLAIIGVRKAEGGVRVGAYKNCYTAGEHAQYRPLFWYKNKDVNEYSKIFNIRHSNCYEVYGLERTGCVGCPYNPKILEELETVIKVYEPKLYKVCNFVFGKAYEYTRKYRQFQADHFPSMRRKKKPEQQVLFEEEVK